ncbi:hypothetical protein BH10PLA2_BH10PLA2_21370 [soil metagenome]
MNYQIIMTARRRVGVVALTSILGMLCSQRTLTAGEPGTGGTQQKVVVGRAALLVGALLHRDNGAWRLLTPQADIYAEDLIVALPAGAINSKNRAVRLTLLSDLARVSPYPVLESAVILHDSPKDLDFTLERGRVDVSNLKRSGEATVRIRFQKQVWDLTLGDRAKIAFELFGRWPAGTNFSKTPKPDETPTLDMVMVVKEGQVNLKADGNEYAMHAPKGVAYYHWDSVPPHDEHPRFLEELPGWTKLNAPPPAVAADLANLIKIIVIKARNQSSGSIEEALASLLTEDSETGRRIAVYGLGALDDLPTVIDALASSKFPDVRDIAVIALRHWIGRSEGQDIKLYDALIKKGYSERNAHRFVQLLHSFSDRQKGSPATYETLIELLQADNAAVRQLANWHLTRLVSKGADIKFDPLGTDAERQSGIQKWKDLIPAGKLPPKA